MEAQKFNIQPRRGLIVWLYSLRQARQLRKFGYVHFVSRKMKYVVIYVNESAVEETSEKLLRLHFVRHIDYSHRPEVDLNFADKIGTENAYPVEEEMIITEEIL